MPLASEVGHRSPRLSASSLTPPSILAASEEPHQLRPLKMEAAESKRRICNYIQHRWKGTVFHTKPSNESFYSISRPAGLSGFDQRGSARGPSFIISNLPPPPTVHSDSLDRSHVCFLGAVQMTVSPTERRRDALSSLRWRHMRLKPSYSQGSSALKQFIEASLHGHGFWNSNLLFDLTASCLTSPLTCNPQTPIPLYMDHTTGQITSCHYFFTSFAWNVVIYK